MARKWIDAQGYEIPPSRVTEQEKAREKMIDRVFKVVWKLRKIVIESKTFIQEEVENYLDEYAHNKDLDEWKGNTGLRDFANKRKVERNVNESMDFTETINIAQQKILNCVHRWSEKANRNLRVVVDDAFRVDSNGKLNKLRILALKRLDVQNEPEWDEAMELISEALILVDSRVYYNFYIKDNKGKKFAVSVNFSYVDANEPLNPAE